MGDPIKTYQDLIAWQKAFALGVRLHRLAATLPEPERYALAAQLRRDAIEVAAKIARGYGAGNRQDYLWHLKGARGDLYKIDTELLFAREFGYTDDAAYGKLKSDLDEAERVLSGLIKSLGG